MKLLPALSLSTLSTGLIANSANAFHTPLPSQSPFLSAVQSSGLSPNSRVGLVGSRTTEGLRAASATRLAFKNDQSDDLDLQVGPDLHRLDSESEKAVRSLMETKKGPLFGIDKLGNKIRTALQRTRDGNEMHLEIDDQLHACHPLCEVGPIKYTMNHNDLTGQRKLRIDTKFVDTDESLYHKLMCDTVYAEWIMDESDESDDVAPQFHIKMHLTRNAEGPGPLWEELFDQFNIPEGFRNEFSHMVGEARKKIFQAHIEDAIEVVFAGIKDLVDENPNLENSKVSVHYLSNREDLQETVQHGSVAEVFEHIQHGERDGAAKSIDEVIAKNIEVWKSALKDVHHVVDRLGQLIGSKALDSSQSAIVQTLLRADVTDLLAMILMVSKDDLFPRS